MNQPRTFVALIMTLIAVASLGVAARASEESVDEATKTALALDVNLKHGRDLFVAQCTGCHGKSGYGDRSRSIPALAGQRFAYLVRQLANFSGDERENAAMHQVVSRGGVRTTQSWADIAGYLSRLPANPKAETGNGSMVALGRGIFQEQCASCHQADAGGDEDGFVPALEGQHYSYLVGQIRQIAADRRHNVDEDLQRFLRFFDENEIEGVADYLARQHAVGKNHQVMRQDGAVVD